MFAKSPLGLTALHQQQTHAQQRTVTLSTLGVFRNYIFALPKLPASSLLCFKHYNKPWPIMQPSK